MAFRETITELMVKVGADISDLKAKFTTVERDTAALGRRMQTLGSKLSVGLTLPLVAFGAAAVKAYADSEDAIAQVEAAIRSTGGAAGKTTEALKKQAEALMKISVFDDDEILGKVTANLLTFTNVAGESFDKAQIAVLNLSARLKTDLQSAAIMVGKALNDPLVGLTALQRAGVQLSAQQKDAVKAFVAVNDIASAQKIILGELENQFGGAAAAAAAAGSGPFLQLKNQIGELTEEIGRQLLPVAKTLLEKVKSLTEWFTDLSEGTQGLIIKFGLFAAALGPVVMLVGRLVELSAILAGSAGFKALVALVGGGAALAAAVGVAGAAMVGYSMAGDNPATRPQIQRTPTTMGQVLGGGSRDRVVPQFQIPGLEALVGATANPPAPPSPEIDLQPPGGGSGFTIPEVIEMLPGLLDSISTFDQLGEVAALRAGDVETLGDRLEDVGTYLADIGSIDPEPLKPDNWTRLTEAVAATTDQMRTLGADALLGLTDSLSMAVGQLVSLQGGFKEFFQNVIKGFQQMIAQIVAAIVKQQILNALIGGGGAAAGVGALGKIGALAGIGSLLLPAALMFGGAAIMVSALEGSKNNRTAQNSMAVSGVVLRSGDIRFSVDESRARGRRIGG